jgi:hypothetical protein
MKRPKLSLAPWWQLAIVVGTMVAAPVDCYCKMQAEEEEERHGRLVGVVEGFCYCELYTKLML